ncbi:MAG: carbamoyltransferase HypF [Butyrivibrio sp.]|nr:carbamoyltransferase HypF [Butyrivibrio sp.]
MTYLITVHGLVQGVGFRPYVKRLADSMSLNGTVRNRDGVVCIQFNGDENTLEAFCKRLCLSLPDGALIERLETEETSEISFDGFDIIESGEGGAFGLPFIPADIAVCEECGRELFDAADRRFGHPFISCAVCGPRYSIINSLPYDRENTVMNAFTMCKKCAAEYKSSADRRFYAQTLACPDCGPRLFFNGSEKEPLDRLAQSLADGKIAAVKDTGGYHFVCDAQNEEAVKRLRRIKLREAKPFAVMFADIRQLKEYARIGTEEEALLKSPARPIVLLEKIKELAPSVCGALPTVGAMLPGNPVQLLLMKKYKGPLVMTSGNLSGEPIITDDGTAAEICRKNGMDLLCHNRRILQPLDDSVARVLCGRTQLIRRAGGYVPAPLDVPDMRADAFIAAGGDLKAAFAVADGSRVIMSRQFGDMEDAEVGEAYDAALKHMLALYSFKPKKILCDLHPSYFSSKKARELAKELGLEAPEPVQHHLAHIMSVAAEHGITGDFTGIAMDGTGFGTDGAVWGGEIFTVSGRLAKRRFHLQYTDVAGGDGAVRDAGLLLKSYRLGAGLAKNGEERQDLTLIKKALDSGINTFKTSSIGRLFDAVSAMLGICSYNRYEGECAILLEAAAASAASAYPLHFEIDKTSGEIGFGALLADIEAALACGVPANEIARGFHMAVVAMLLEAASICGNSRVLISGGVFMNRLICEELIRRGGERGFEIFWNEKVPPGDGGVALGQIAAAAWGVRSEE